MIFFFIFSQISLKLVPNKLIGDNTATFMQYALTWNQWWPIPWRVLTVPWYQLASMRELKSLQNLFIHNFGFICLCHVAQRVAVILLHTAKFQNDWTTVWKHWCVNKLMWDSALKHVRRMLMYQCPRVLINELCYCNKPINYLLCYDTCADRENTEYWQAEEI